MFFPVLHFAPCVFASLRVWMSVFPSFPFDSLLSSPCKTVTNTCELRAITKETFVLLHLFPTNVVFTVGFHISHNG